MNVIKGTTLKQPKKIAIIAAQFNFELTEAMVDQALLCLMQKDYPNELITVIWVPGAVEIGFVANRLANSAEYGAIITFGAIIKGETAHFDYVSQICTNACQEITLRYDIPVVFGVLTTYDRQQALARVNGEHSNNGVEAIMTALDMMSIAEQLK